MASRALLQRYAELNRFLVVLYGPPQCSFENYRIYNLYSFSSTYENVKPKRNRRIRKTKEKELEIEIERSDRIERKIKERARKKLKIERIEREVVCFAELWDTPPSLRKKKHFLCILIFINF